MMKRASFSIAVMVAAAAFGEELGPISGYEYMEAATQAMQDDDFLNPSFFLVDEGQRLWLTPLGANGLTCADCHGAPNDSMVGVAARYPVFDAESGALMNLELRIIDEVHNRMGGDVLDYDAPEVMALTTYISYLSRGLEMTPLITSETQPFVDLGREIFETRRGQLNLSCPQCHVDHAGDRLRGDVISQGQINAFPIYRLLWSEPGSRHRMFEWCMQSVRAKPFARGSQEFVALELYLAQRGAGLPIEAPGVRR